MLDEKYIALIDDYLNGILDPEVKANLENELNDNPELRDLLSIIQLSREGIELSGKKDMIQKIHEEFINENKEVKETKKISQFKITPWWLGIAASLTLLILVGNFWINTQIDDFFEAKYMAYELPTMRSAFIEENQILNSYRNNDHESVISLIDISSDGESNLFLAGLSHLAIGNYEKSAQFLTLIEQINSEKPNEEKLFQDEIEYYLFLLYLKLENLEQANAFYKRIIENENHTYHKSIDTIDKVKFLILRLKK